jgi:hypothetical protein
MPHSIWRRMISLAEHVGIQPSEYDMNPIKLKSLIINGVYIIRKGIVEKFIIYMAKLSEALKEKLNQLINEMKLKDRIGEELERLGIPAKKFSTIPLRFYIISIF